MFINMKQSSLYAYLWSIFGGSQVMKQRIKKHQRSIQMDRRRDRMKTILQNKTIMNPLLKKRFVSEDKVATEPLRNMLTNKFL